MCDREEVLMRTIAMALLAGTLSLGGAGGARADEDEAGHHHQSVTMAELPAAVQKTLNREAKGGKIEELRKETHKNGKVIYEAEIGALPADRVLDHLCRRILCVRALHLEPVTRHENELRKSWAYRCRRLLCPRGHEYAKHVLVTPELGRLCRECQRT